MTVLEIVDWNDHFETHQSRVLKTLPWVAIPTKMDGDGFTELMDHKNGMLIFGAWMLMVEITSKGHPRGLLLRSGLRPHTPKSLARMTHREVDEFELAIPVLLDMGWLRYKEITEEELAVIPRNPALHNITEQDITEQDITEQDITEQKGHGLDPSLLEKQKNLTRARNLAYSEIIPYLNEKTNRRYSIANKATQRHINARLSEGYTIEDFKAVIDKKTAEWLNDPKMSPYLRPQTLFAGKFEGYLNQPTVGPGGKTTVSERTGFIK